MSDDKDYLTEHGGRLVQEDAATRLLVEDNNVLFLDQAADGLRRVVNNAVGFALAYFTDNLHRSGEAARITEREVEQVAIKVALRYLYMRNIWRVNGEGHRDYDLVLTLDDLLHPYTRDEILAYCEATFPEDYQAVAASLVGTARDEFAEWEMQRRAFWERW